MEEGKEKLFLLAYLQEETISRVVIVVFRRPVTRLTEIKQIANFMRMARAQLLDFRFVFVDRSLFYLFTLWSFIR